MKNHWIIIRIVLAMGAIFALGIWVGRLTAPKTASEPFVISIDKNDSTDEADLKRVILRALTRYRADLDLTKEQTRTLRPIFVTASRRMQVLPKLSRARLAALEDFHDELKPHLSDDQKDKLGAIMEKALSRHRTD